MALQVLQKPAGLPTAPLQVTQAPAQAPLTIAKPATQQPLSIAKPQPQAPLSIQPVAGQPKITSVGDLGNMQPYTQKKSVAEFAAAIKQQYPAYASADDNKLAEAMVLKYPQYASQVAFPEQQDEPSQERGWVRQLFGPEITGLATAARAVQSTPKLLQGIGQVAKQAWNDPASVRDAILHPNTPLLNAPAVQEAGEIQRKSIGSVKTAPGMTTKELLGSATQALGQLSLITGNTSLGFGLQGAGNAAEDNKSAGQILARGTMDAVIGKLGEKYLPTVLSGAYRTFVPQAAKNLVEPLLSKVSSTVTKGLEATGNAVNPYLDKIVPESFSNKTFGRAITDKLVKPTIASLEDTYTELFTGTKSSTKALNKSAQAGKDPAKFLADRGYAVEVTSGGKINSQPVIQQLSKDVEPLESTLDDILKAKDRISPSSERISLDDIANEAKGRINTSQARGSGTLQDQEKAIEAIVTNLKKTYGDTVGLSDLNEIKRGQWQQSSSFDLSRPKFMGDVNYAIGKSAKETIELNVPEAAIRDLNSFVGDHYDAISNLRRIDGNTIKGGRLGRYVNRMIGATLGSHFGGPFGTLAGERAGAYITEIVQNNSISNPLKRMILQSIPEDNALFKAAQQALKTLEAMPVPLRSVATPPTTIKPATLGQPKLNPESMVRVNNYQQPGFPKYVPQTNDLSINSRKIAESQLGEQYPGFIKGTQLPKAAKNQATRRILTGIGAGQTSNR